MKSFDYEAVIYNGDVFCTDCCPVSLKHEDVFPIFADQELQSPVKCDACGWEHNYFNIINYSDKEIENESSKSNEKVKT